MAKKRVPSAPVAYTESERRNGLAGEDVDIIKIKSGALHMPRLMMSDQQGCRKTENGEWKKRITERKGSFSFGSLSYSSATTANFDLNGYFIPFLITT